MARASHDVGACRGRAASLIRVRQINLRRLLDGPMTRANYLLLLTICWLGLVADSWAVRIEDLETGRAWRLRAVRFMAMKN
jgi:hypothetical protein